MAPLPCHCRLLTSQRALSQGRSRSRLMSPLAGVTAANALRESASREILPATSLNGLFSISFLAHIRRGSVCGALSAER